MSAVPSASLGTHNSDRPLTSWQCPLWVRSRHVQCKTSCLLCPRKRTCEVQTGMSALGQKRTCGVPQGSFARAGCPLLDRPVPTGALSLDLRFCILTNFIAQPCDELFNDLAFGS